MKKRILIITGSPRVGIGTKVAEQLSGELQAAQTEVIHLREKKINPCLGCQVCYMKGDAACPQKDDLQKIYAKMRQSDAVVFISPVYVMDVSGLMKNFFDRLSFVCHRPQFFGKRTVLITYAAVFGSGHSLKTMKLTASMWEFDIADAIGMNLEFKQDKQMLGETNKKRISKAAGKLLKALDSPQPAPGLFSLIGFQVRKKGFRNPTPGALYEHEYWKRKGWLDGDFYCKARINPIKLLLSKAIARIIIGK